jgi:hypothetical protein
MSYRGHKGAIGYSGNANLPDWVRVIVDFRNSKYNEDLRNTHYSKMDILDEEYDNIDKAINTLLKIDTKYLRNIKIEEILDNETSK